MYLRSMRRCLHSTKARLAHNSYQVLRLFVGGTLIDMLSFPEVCCDGTKRA